MLDPNVRRVVLTSAIPRADHSCRCDVQIAMTSEVRGHVKLRFQNQQKEKVIVERRLQVSKKKGGAPGLTMKTLEATMAWVDAKDKDKVRSRSLLVPLKLSKRS